MKITLVLIMLLSGCAMHRSDVREIQQLPELDTPQLPVSPVANAKILLNQNSLDWPAQISPIGIPEVNLTEYPTFAPVGCGIISVNPLNSLKNSWKLTSWQRYVKQAPLYGEYDRWVVFTLSIDD